MPKTALVVDDSRVAVLGLSRLLKEQGLLVDTAESGPEAIDYLRSNPPPAAIFLDHMMPGMDGFETLAVLKSSPATSAIPVVMYTSKDGEAYLHEAQARGAFGVLLKPPQPREIQRILTALPDVKRRSEAGVAEANTAPARAAPAAIPAPLQEPAQARSAELPPPRSGFGLGVLGAATLLFAVGAAWSYALYQEAEQRSAQLLVQNAGLKQEQARLLTENGRLQLEHESAKTAAAQPRISTQDYQSLLDIVSWSLSEQGRYDFGEVPFSDARLRVIRALVTRLAEANFHGLLRLDAHLGEFCLVRDSQGRMRLPPPGTPFSACERVSHPPAEAERLARRQSEAFGRYVADNNAARGPIEIVVHSHGASRPLQRYPESAPFSAAEWNAVARRNQRVDITLVPAAP